MTHYLNAMKGQICRKYQIFFSVFCIGKLLNPDGEEKLSRFYMQNNSLPNPDYKTRRSIGEIFFYMDGK